MLKEKLDLDWKQMPSPSTWQRLIGGNIDASEFDEKVGGYFQSLSSDEQKLFNLDGKVVCGTIDKKTENNTHLLALQESETNLVVKQTELLAGENEISGAGRLLEKATLENKIVSGDAIFAQKNYQIKWWQAAGNICGSCGLIKARFINWRKSILRKWKIDISGEQKVWKKDTGEWMSEKS